MAYPGSYFKNPVLSDGTKMAAGSLLEKVAAKDLSVGGAAVYSGHANFILNLGRAKAKDVLLLAQELKSRVKKGFGIDLEEEVIYLPADSSMP
jgi:UDP-N-acetylmuramate dehydrogenase